MLPVLVDRDDAATIGQLLRDAVPLLGRVNQDRRVSRDLRDAACYWADAMTEPLEALDVGTVAWLLRDIAGQRRLPMSLRDRARYWAADLEGRLVS